MFLMFSYHFDVLTLKFKNNFLKIKKYIILICFGMKNNRYHTPKHPINLCDLELAFTHRMFCTLASEPKKIFVSKLKTWEEQTIKALTDIC